ncbi:MAG: hypothetical protein K2P81_03000 [Bacteriovoracaceae bacterium]|nr:hypothetical protein [Bacteriovoracaceae bacterium]
MRILTLSLIAMLALAGCLPTAKQQSCGTGSVFNSVSRACVPITSGGSTSGVSIGSKSPVVSNLTVAQSQVTTSTFSVTVLDPLSQGYVIRWLLYPPSGVTFTGNPLLLNTASYGLSPASLGMSPGLWTLAAEIYNSTGASLVTSAQWTVTVSSNPTPTLSYNSGSAIQATTASRLTTDTATTYLAVNVTDTASTPTAWTMNWYYDGVLMKTGSSTGSKTPITSSATYETFFSTGNALASDNPPISAGPHIIRAELRNGSSIYDFKEWQIYVYAPNLPQLSNTAVPLPNTSVTVSAIDGVSLASGGFRSNSANIFPGSGFCVAVNDFDGTRNNSIPGGVVVQFKNNGTPVGAPQTFSANHSYVCLETVNSAFNMTLANANVGEFKTVTASITDVDTNTTVATVAWGVSIRPKNTAPVANIASPTSTLVIQLQDTTTSYTMTVTDDDTTSADNMNIDFYIDGVVMNGVNNFPGTSVLTPDCSHLPSVAPTGAARLTCNVTIPSYDLLGRVDPRFKTYTITARATDQAVNGGAAQTSNIISWTMNPINTASPLITDTAPTIAAQGGSTTTNSYIATLASPSTPTGGPIAEMTDIVFSVLVNDTQRDNFRVQIDHCLDGAPCTSTASVAGQFLVTRGSDTLGKRVSVNYQIPETAITGAASGTVTYRITVQDQLPDYNSDSIVDLGSAVTSFMTLSVTNKNPFPVWAGSAGANPTLASSLSVMTGMPLTLDPGTITDASTADGETILYQWEISTDGGTTWNTITGATSKILKWTPGDAIAGSAVQLRLCLGDNGTGNGLALCTGLAAPTAPPLPATTRVAGPWTGVVAKGNKISKNIINPTANGEVATWYDATERELYMAYVNKAGVNSSSIVVEKYDVATNGTISYVKAVSFATERTGPAYDASALSVVGQRVVVSGKTYRGLYVSYVTMSAPTISPQMRVRHIDLTDDELNFTYSGFYESNSASQDIFVTEGTTPGQVTLQVVDTVFDAGEYILINGVKLTPVAVGAMTSLCEFEADATLTTDQVMANIETRYYTCIGSTGDARSFTPNVSVNLDQWPITNFPQNWVDLSYSLFLGKAGEIMLQSDTLLIPFLDNLNSGKLSVAILGTTNGGFSSGTVAKTAAPYAQTPTYVAISSTVQGQDLANSYSGTGSFDVAMTTSVSGLNVYRLSFNPPSTVGLTNQVLNVFGAGEFVQKPRIATGASATNNHVFLLAQDTTSATKELFHARIAASTYTLAPGSPFIPFDGVHEQAQQQTEYKIRALTGDKRAVVSSMTDAGEILISMIKPVSTGSDVPMIRPVAGGAGSAYPRLDSGVSTSVATLSMMWPFTMTVGDAGATASENSQESVVVLYPSSAASGLTARFINVVESSIQATSVDGSGRFQPPYIK